jgi:hypothetical protein
MDNDSPNDILVEEDFSEEKCSTHKKKLKLVCK